MSYIKSFENQYNTIGSKIKPHLVLKCLSFLRRCRDIGQCHFRVRFTLYLLALSVLSLLYTEDLPTSIVCFTCSWRMYLSDCWSCLPNSFPKKFLNRKIRYLHLRLLNGIQEIHVSVPYGLLRTFHNHSPVTMSSVRSKEPIFPRQSYTTQLRLF